MNKILCDSAKKPEAPCMQAELQGFVLNGDSETLSSTQEFPPQI